MPEFFDNYQDLGGGGTFITSDEKQYIIENGVVFSIHKLGKEREEDAKYEPGYIAFCSVPDLNDPEGEVQERKLRVPYGTGVNTRDDMMAAMKEYLESEGSVPVQVKLEKPGRAILIVNAAAGE